MAWKTVLLSVTLCFSTISAQENTGIREFFPSTSLVDTDGMANSIVNNCVSVISGDFIEQNIDLALDGPTPLVIGHGYSSGNNSNSSISYGWNFMHPHDLFIRLEESENDKEEHYTAYCGEDSGGMHRHSGKRKVKDKKNKLSFDKADAWGSVSFSGKADLRNISIDWDRENEKCYVKSGSGEFRKFERIGGKKFQEFVQTRSVKPDNTGFEYTYSRRHASRVNNIAALNAPHGLPYASVDFDYYKHPSIIHVTSHDNRYVRYTLKSYAIKDREVEEKFKRYVSEIRGSDCPLRMYTYHHNQYNTGMLLNSRVSVTGYFIQPLYYKSKETTASKNGLIYHATDIHGDKVKKLKEPVGTTNHPIRTYSFVYNCNDRDGSYRWSTDVYNSAFNKTTYYHNRNNIKKIEFYNGTFPNFGLDHTENYVWNSNHKLTEKTDQDSSGTVVRSRSFTYDERGNILSDTLSGNLTGHGDEEKYTHWYKYSDDGYNNLIAEGEEEGPTTEYEYLFNSNKLIARYISTNKGIELREFRYYDAWGLCFCETHDNGCSKDFNDLTNVTERVSTFREYHTGKPLFGKVHTEKVVCVDPHTGALTNIKRTQFTYNDTGKLIQKDTYDADDNYCYTLAYGYDSKGRPIWETDPYGGVKQRGYDEEGNILFEKGVNANVEKFYTYDFAHRLIKEEERYSDGTVLSTRHHYNHLNQKKSSVDHLEQKTSYRYDDFGRLTQTIFPKVNLLGEVASPQTKNAYDSLGNVIYTLNKDGLEISKKYTVRGDVYETTYPDGTLEKKYYTLGGKLLEEVHPDGTSIRYTYDKLGNTLTEGFYDPEGNLLSEKKTEWRCKRKTAQYNPLGISTVYTYDGLGRCIEETKGAHRITYKYSSRGYLEEEKQYDNAQLLQIKQRKHDFFGRIFEEKHLDAEENIQLHQTFTYDAVGRKVAETIINDKDESFITLTSYDLRSRIIKITHTDGAETHYAYLTEYDPISGGWIEILEVTDTSGRITREYKDALGRIILSELYDQFGQLLQKKTSSYNLYGKCIEARDSLIFNQKEECVQIRNWNYDLCGRVIAETAYVGTPNQNITKNTYDNRGRKICILRNDGTELHWEYDFQGRVKKEYDSKKTFEHHYTYDLCSHPLTFWDPIQGWKIERTYSSQEQLEEEKFSPLLGLKYTYDALDRPLTMTLHDGSSVKYAYKGFDHEETIRINPDKEEIYRHSVKSRDLAGRILSLQLAGKAGEIAFSYDSKGRMNSLDHTHLKGEFVYSLNDNLIESKYQDPQGNTHKKYSYDELNQLTQENGKEHYQYDSLGNRRTADDIPYIICPHTNRLLEFNGVKYAYDDNGNLLSDGNNRYEYDSLDRLKKVIRGDDLWKYTYDAFHRRISKEYYQKSEEGLYNPISKENYIYVGVTEIGAVDEKNQFTSLRILGQGKQSKEGQAAAIELNGKAFAPLYDHQGSLRLLIDIETGASAACYRYDAFGCKESESNSLPSACPWQYLGKRFDKETGFTFFGRRYYMPLIGRWLTSDPSGYSAGANGYLYVKNNPLTLFDLYGLQEASPFIDIYQFVGQILFHLIANIPRFGVFSKGFAYVPFLMMGYPSEEFDAYYGYENSSSHVIGEDPTPGEFAVVAFTGIANTLKDNTDMALKLQYRYETKTTYGCHNSTHGFCWDIIECIAMKLGIKTHSVEVAVAQLRGLCSDHNKVFVHAHSQGALTVACALDYLTPEELSKLHIRTYGGAKIILRDGLGSCFNYVSKRDPVPFIADPIGLLIGYWTNDVRLEFVNNESWIEHGFAGKTYSGQLICRAERDKLSYKL